MAAAAAATCSGMTITVFVCAVFVFGVDDYQPPALSPAYFRAEFEHSEVVVGGRHHAAGCFFSSGVVSGHEVFAGIKRTSSLENVLCTNVLKHFDE